MRRINKAYVAKKCNKTNTARAEQLYYPCRKKKPLLSDAVTWLRLLAVFVLVAPLRFHLCKCDFLFFDVLLKLGDMVPVRYGCLKQLGPDNV